MLPVLGDAALGECRVGPLAEKIADEFGPTPAEREAMLPSGSRRVRPDRIHWAKFETSKAGPIASPGRGRFSATEAGETLPARRPERIDVALPRMFPAFVEVVVDEDRPGLDRLCVQAERRGAGAPSADRDPRRLACPLRRPMISLGRQSEDARRTFSVVAW